MGQVKGRLISCICLVGIDITRCQFTSFCGDYTNVYQIQSCLCPFRRAKTKVNILAGNLYFSSTFID